MENKLPKVGTVYASKRSGAVLTVKEVRHDVAIVTDGGDLWSHSYFQNEFVELPKYEAETKPKRDEQTTSFQDAIYDLKHEVESIKYGDDLKINPASTMEYALQKKLARLVDKAEKVINTETKNLYF